jgi:hypothetical protein
VSGVTNRGGGRVEGCENSGGRERRARFQIVNFQIVTAQNKLLYSSSCRGSEWCSDCVSEACPEKGKAFLDSGT